MYERKEIHIKKTIILILIISHVMSYLINTFDEYFKKDINHELNKYLLTERLYYKLLIDLFSEKKITAKYMNLFCSCHVKYNKIKHDRKYPYKCKNPNKKWAANEGLHNKDKEKIKRDFEKKVKKNLQIKLKRNLKRIKKIIKLKIIQKVDLKEIKIKVVYS